MSGPPMVGGQDQAGTLGGQQLERGEGLLDAGGVIDDHHAVLLLDRKTHV